VSPTLVRRAAHAYVLLTAGVVAFQGALVAGAPWGHLTQGGGHPGALPASQRGVALVSAGVLLVAAFIVGRRAGLWGPSGRTRGTRAAWVVVAYLALGVVLNAITPSAAERMLWLPVTLLMATTAGLVARHAGRAP
jgi:hypothetical protein